MFLCFENFWNIVANIALFAEGNSLEVGRFLNFAVLSFMFSKTKQLSFNYAMYFKFFKEENI